MTAKLTDPECQSIRLAEAGLDFPDRTFATVERIIRDHVAQALRDAADDPTMRLSGHSGVSITRLRQRADSLSMPPGACR